MHGVGKSKIKEKRKAYAELLVATCRSERIREDSFEDMDWSTATYEPFDEILRHEGGGQNEENIVAAMNYCKWCLKKGGRWVK